MDKMITDYLSKLEFGEIQQFKNMGIVPLLTPANGSPKYITLEEGLKDRLLTITEVSDSGSVPELKVVNRAKVPVLLLDGEELVGAKQNRVLNATILLRKESETIIPVSCTEGGRWAHVSREFAFSNAFVSSRLRMRKQDYVAHSLKRSGRFESDQAGIWDEISEISADAGVRSDTGAMRQVFDDRMSDLEDYLGAFEYVPRQKGLLVFVNGEVMGFDIVSLESAYKVLHPKLVRGCAMDALLARKEKNAELSVNKARSFLEESAGCKEDRYKSIGHGWDHRFDRETMVGSALVYRKKVIHTAFFRRGAEGHGAGRMAGYGRRSNFRI